jgi:hypothetical protein
MSMYDTQDRSDFPDRVAVIVSYLEGCKLYLDRPPAVIDMYERRLAAVTAVKVEPSAPPP